MLFQTILWETQIQLCFCYKNCYNFLKLPLNRFLIQISCLCTCYQRIPWVCSLGWESLLNFTCRTMKLHNYRHATAKHKCFEAATLHTKYFHAENKFSKILPLLNLRKLLLISKIHTYHRSCVFLPIMHGLVCQLRLKGCCTPLIVERFFLC